MSSSHTVVYIISEGKTEKQFVNGLLAPYMAKKGIYLYAPIIGEQGRKGGDIRFSRFERSIGQLLIERKDAWVSLMVDYYGIKSDWPGYAESKQEVDHAMKATIMNRATANEVQRLFPDQNRNERFIPYISMYEIEALYFSDPACIANQLNVNQKEVDAVIQQFGEPEKINDSPTGAPSKRLTSLSLRFKKTDTGMVMAKLIGIPKMREACPLFDDWLKRLEALAGDLHGQG